MIIAEIYDFYKSNEMYDRQRSQKSVSQNNPSRRDLNESHHIPCFASIFNVMFLLANLILKWIPLTNAYDESLQNLFLNIFYSLIGRHFFHQNLDINNFVIWNALKVILCAIFRE